MTHFACPICGGRIKENRRGLSCKRGHRFDAAAQGYVNLLTNARLDPKTTGDNPLMVKARTDFLEAGYYRPLADKIGEISKGLLADIAVPVVIDCGCGEGYYTAIYAAALKNASVYGIDLSKSAVKHAASRAGKSGIENVRFAAASCFDMPFADRTADLLISAFAPVSGEEFARVLKKGGKLVIVCPSPIHLSGLKAVLYDEPYPNKPNEYGLKGFAALDSLRLEYTVTLKSNKEIADLFAMTPYYYKTPEEGRKRLGELETLTTECGFDILVFRKK